MISVDDSNSINQFGDYSISSNKPAAAPAPAVSVSSNASNPPVAVPSPSPVASVSPIAPSGRVFASPSAKLLAKQHNVNILDLQGSGPGGRIIAADVEIAKTQPKTVKILPVEAGAVLTAAPVETGQWNLQDCDGMLRDISIYSKQTVPHYYLSVEVNCNEVLKLRDQYKDIKLNLMDFFIKAASLSMKQVSCCCTLHRILCFPCLLCVPNDDIYLYLRYCLLSNIV